MPELPEVETTLRGIQPYLQNQCIKNIIVRDRRLRWPVQADLDQTMSGALVKELKRRSKYIFVITSHGSLIIHLGMSGSLRVVDADLQAGKHDHVDLVLSSGKAVRFHDPRRFGCVLWTDEDLALHPLIKHLGPEPLSSDFDGELLYSRSRGRQLAVKNFIMDAKVVVGVGNIYASESLFRAGIDPRRSAGKISKKRYIELAKKIRETLIRSIELGGTTLRDFVNPEGAPGYFEQTLLVYGRTNQLCQQCDSAIRQVVLGQRSSFYCPTCQR
jgi:formamidopyrimidine-DNA glycosylase